MKSLFFASLLMAGTQMAYAQQIDCPAVGTILLNGDSAILTYAPEMGFSDNTDTASFVSLNDTDSSYQANKWGAFITIPNALIDGRAQEGDVSFDLPETATRMEHCFLK